MTRKASSDIERPRTGVRVNGAECNSRPATGSLRPEGKAVRPRTDLPVRRITWTRLTWIRVADLPTCHCAQTKNFSDDASLRN